MMDSREAIITANSILLRLSNSNEVERSQVQQQLRGLQPEVEKVLLSMAMHEASKLRRYMLCAWLIWIGSTIITVCSISHTQLPSTDKVVAGLWLTVCFVVTVFLMAGKLRPRYRSVIYALTFVNNTQIVNLFADVINFDWPQIRSNIIIALTREIAKINTRGGSLSMDLQKKLVYHIYYVHTPSAVYIDFAAMVFNSIKTNADPNTLALIDRLAKRKSENPTIEHIGRLAENCISEMNSTDHTIQRF